MSIFTPRLSEPQNQVQVRRPTGLNTTAEAIELASQVGGEVLRSTAVSELSSELEQLKKARLSGGDRHKLSLKADVALNRAKVAAPLLAKDLDAVYKSTFGGGAGGSKSAAGGAGGVFAATPVEKGLEKTQQEAGAISGLTGWSVEDSIKYLNRQRKMEESSKELEEQAKKKAGAKEENYDLVFGSMALKRGTIGEQMSASILAAGSLDSNAKREFKTQLGLTKMAMMRELDSMVFDADNGLTIDQTLYQKEVEAIDGVIANLTAIVDNNDYQKLLTEETTENTLESTLAAQKLFPAFSGIKAVFGESLVKDVWNSYNEPQGLYAKVLAKTDPMFKKMFENPDKYVRESIGGMNKIFDVTKSSEQLTQAEAVAFGTTVNTMQPQSMVQLFMTLNEQDNGGARVAEVIKHVPEASAVFTKPEMVKAIKKDPKRFENVFQSTANMHFINATSSYMAINGRTPTGLVVRAKTVGGSKTVEVVDSTNGELPEALMVQARGLYEMYDSNPAVLRDLEKQHGLEAESVTPELATSYVLNNGASSMAESLATQQKAVEEVKPEVKEEAEQQPLDLNSLNEEAARQGVDLSTFDDGEYVDDKGNTFAIQGGKIVEVR